MEITNKAETLAENLLTRLGTVCTPGGITLSAVGSKRCPLIHGPPNRRSGWTTLHRIPLEQTKKINQTPLRLKGERYGS